METSTPLDPRALELVAARFRLLGDPMRLRILQALRSSPRSVGELTNLVDSTQPNVSKHLKIMQDAGVLERRPRGNFALYAIADATVFALCDVVCRGLQSRFEEQARVLGHASSQPLEERSSSADP
jgi:DNA-binding transcriptional ArsR family regulator